MDRRLLLASGKDSGGGGSSLITFTVDDVQYQAEEGMTWGELVDSEYNVNRRFYIELDNSIGIRNEIGGWLGTDEDYVYASDIIQENYNYLIMG